MSEVLLLFDAGPKPGNLEKGVGNSDGNGRFGGADHTERMMNDGAGGGMPNSLGTTSGSKQTSSAMFLSVTKILSTCVLFCNAVADFVDRFLWGRNEMDK